MVHQAKLGQGFVAQLGGETNFRRGAQGRNCVASTPRLFGQPQSPGLDQQRVKQPVARIIGLVVLGLSFYFGGLLYQRLVRESAKSQAPAN